MRALSGLRHSGWYAVGVLQLTYAVAFLDRAILGLLVEPVRAELALSDVQISLLLGVAFALLHVGLGVPLGTLADRWHRPRLLAACALVWCVATAASGLAGGFAALFVARILVGAGEAGLGPIAPTLIADHFEGPRRSVAISIYQMASSIGAGLALIAGGAVLAWAASANFGEGVEPWRLVFITVGLGGLIVPLLLLTVPEPRRQPTRSATAASWRDIATFLGRHRHLVLCHFGGFALFTTLSYGVAGWIPAFLERNHGWSGAEIGLRYGIIILLAGTSGVLAGGAAAARLRRTGRTDVAAGIMALGAAGAGLFATIAPLAADGTSALALYGIAIFWLSFPTGVSVAAVQDIAPTGAAARVTALYFITIAVIGMPLGPLTIAWANEGLFGGGMGLAPALSLNGAVLGTLAGALLWAARPAYRRALSHDRQS